MGNVYWAGALPGLVVATGLSLAALRLLGPTRIRHIVWLVPALHFAGAFAIGPALSIAYGILIVPTAGGSAPLAWVLALLGVAAAVGTAAWRGGGARRGAWAATCFGIPALAAILIPIAFHVIAG